MKSLECVTESGEDCECVFPFLAEGESYSACSDPFTEGGLWCATALQKDGEYSDYGWCIEGGSVQYQPHQQIPLFALKQYTIHVYISLCIKLLPNEVKCLFIALRVAEKEQSAPQISLPSSLPPCTNKQLSILFR